MGHSKISSKRGVYSHKDLPEETRKISGKQSNFIYLKELEKEEQTKPKEGRRKEIIRITAERNQTETKKKK